MNTNDYIVPEVNLITLHVENGFAQSGLEDSGFLTIPDYTEDGGLIL